MAFAMTTQGQSSVFNAFGPTTVPGPVPPIQLADQTFTTTKTNTAAQNLTYPCSKFQVMLLLKTYVVGTTAVTGGGPVVGPLFWLEAADNSGMTTNLTVLGGMQQAPNIASATYTGGLVLMWWASTPIAAKQFVRIVVDPTLQTGAVAGTYDVLILAEP